MINLDEIKAIINSQGIRFRESSTSLTLNYCPSCGSHKYKVAFALKTLDKGLLGKCFRGKCQEGFSLYKYLLLAGVSKDQIELMFGTNPEVAINALNVSNDIFSETMVKNFEEKDDTIKPKTKAEIAKIIEGFFKLSSWRDHPATEYALSRGVRLGRDDHYVRINPNSNSVVFLCFDDAGDCNGFQERYLKPAFEDMKTKTLPGFDAHKNVMFFPGPGDIAVCEGPFTAIAALNYGYAAVTTFGSGISVTQMDKIVALAKKLNKNIAIAFDKDEAGRDGSSKMERYFGIKDVKYYMVAAEVGTDLADSWKADAGVIVSPPSIENIYVPDIPLFGI